MLSETEQEDFCMNETMIKILGFDKVDTKLDRKINENKIRILEILYNESNDAGVGYYHGADLKNLSGVSINIIRGCMDRLEEQGLIVRDYEYKGAQQKKKYVFTELFYNTAEKAGIKLTKKPRHIIDTSDEFTNKERSELLAKKARRYRKNSLDPKEYEIIIKKQREPEGLKIRMGQYELLAQKIWENMKKSTA